MTEVQKALDNAFDVLSTIPVSGDNVEKMAIAREHLRRAFRLAGNVEQKEAEKHGG